MEIAVPTDHPGGTLSCMYFHLDLQPRFLRSPPTLSRESQGLVLCNVLMTAYCKY